MIEITGVFPGSTADHLGIAAGDRLVAINGREIRDSIDYYYHVSDERLSLLIERPGGRRKRYNVTKAPDDTLGVELAPLVIRRCRNKCIFCFVDQMPPGCRKSLYVKDDDYRASFLFGNYITLGNLREEDWSRIFEQRLSPLYVSVHATEAGLRASILNNRSVPDIMDGLRRLAAGGIRIHAQIVLCPGINDGQHLAKTVEDLASLFPAVRSVAAVPVGITGHRRGLALLRPYRRSEALKIVEDLEAWGKRFRKRRGTRLVYPADELYIKAGVPVPPLSFYEDLPQIENGVGMVAQYLQEARAARIPRRMKPVRATAITGTSFAPILAGSLERLMKLTGEKVKVLAVRNEFFGHSVTVSGLLTGRDIITAVRGKKLGDLLFIPAAALNEDRTHFLDDLSMIELERTAGVPVKAVGSLSELIAELVSRKG